MHSSSLFQSSCFQQMMQTTVTLLHDTRLPQVAAIIVTSQGESVFETAQSRT
jgi:hypothetical protein